MMSRFRDMAAQILAIYPRKNRYDEVYKIEEEEIGRTIEGLHVWKLMLESIQTYLQGHETEL